MKLVDVVSKLEVKVGDKTEGKFDSLTIPNVYTSSATVPLPKGGGKAFVLHQLPEKTGKIYKPVFVLLQSDYYDPKLVYYPGYWETEGDVKGDVKEEAPTPDAWFVLDGPHQYLGEGQVRVLCNAADVTVREKTGNGRETEREAQNREICTSLNFKNDSDQDIMVTIYWGFVE